VATETKERGRVIVQSVLPPALAERLKAQAELERRSVSATIRNAIADALEPGRRP
jgi:predicted transcriptional regulator